MVEVVNMPRIVSLWRFGLLLSRKVPSADKLTLWSRSTRKHHATWVRLGWRVYLRYSSWTEYCFTVEI